VLASTLPGILHMTHALSAFMGDTTEYLSESQTDIMCLDSEAGAETSEDSRSVPDILETESNLAHNTHISIHTSLLSNLLNSCYLLSITNSDFEEFLQPPEC
jgi:hypothetical protein